MCFQILYPERNKTNRKPHEYRQNTMKLTLGQAAKAARRSKGTLSKALNSGGMSAKKDEKGRWQIDPAELSRWMDANPVAGTVENQMETPEETHDNSALGVENRMLRGQIETLNVERGRERDQLVDQIEDLRARLDSAEAERLRLNAVLTDQREQATPSHRRGLWARLVG